MRRISIKAILIGGSVDILLSFLLAIPFAMFALTKANLAHVPKSQVHTVTSAALKTTPMRVAELIIGFGCSILGGYVAASIAKHDELLNGGLASILCTLLGIYWLYSGKNSHSVMFTVAMFIASPVMGLIGGRLKLLRKDQRPHRSRT